MMHIDLQKPLLDDRTYRFFTLENELQVLVISDPTTDKAAASLDVNVGHYLDPVDMQGLAHFLEHMLFLGTEKYPEERNFTQYLSENGGTYNAYTADFHTNYFFDIAHEFLEPALDRFAQFFIAPLFTESCTERELNAVDSEHKKNLQRDAWRLNQLDRFLSISDHMFHKFGTGNMQTLRDIPLKKGIRVRDRLLEFHDAHYSSNLMKLVVIGREPADVLCNWTRDIFSLVRNKGRAPPRMTDVPFSADHLRICVDVVPVKDENALCVSFPLPDQLSLYEAKPTSYISHLVGHESRGSVLSLLKHNTWATNLSCGLHHNVAGFATFSITVDLTMLGLEHSDDILVILFAYLNLIRRSGIQTEIYEECRVLSETRFRYKEKKNPSQYVTGLACAMHVLPPPLLLKGHEVFLKFDATTIDKVMQCLVPDNMRIFMMSQTLAQKDMKIEENYGTHYSVRTLSSEELDRLNNASPDSFPSLLLPEKNRFIPNDFSLKVDHTTEDSVGGRQIPVCFYESARSKGWFKQDSTFRVPKLNACFALRSALCAMSVRYAVLTHLFKILLEDTLQEMLYAATLAGTHVDLSVSAEGLFLQVHGFSDKQLEIYREVFSTLMAFTVHPARFESWKQELTRSYANFRFELPHSHARFMSGFVMTSDRVYTHDDRLAALKDIQLDDMTDFVKLFLSDVYLECFFHGNSDENESRLLLAHVEKILFETAPSAVGGDHVLQRLRSVQLPRGLDVCLTRALSDEEMLHSATLVQFQIGAACHLKERVLCYLLSQVIEESFFYELRTVQQLGYIVSCSPLCENGVVCMRFIVQSEMHPSDVQPRVNSFTESILDTVKRMSATDFNTNLNALLANLTEKDKNLRQETNRWWNYIVSGYYDFFRKEDEIAMARQLTVQMLIGFCEQYISLSSEHCARLLVHFVSEKAPPVKETTQTNRRQIDLLDNRHVNTFKLSLPLYPAPIPMQQNICFSKP